MTCLVGFVVAGWQRMLDNANSADGDQGAYLQLGLNLRQYGVLTDGTRNPLYPALLATFAEREWRYFTYAKFLSLMFGVMSILALYYIGSRLFDPLTALLAAFLLSINVEFTLHSIFALAESLLVLSILGTWFFMIQALRRPDQLWWWGVAGGGAGLAYLTKGTGQLVMFCFVLTVFLLFRLRLWSMRGFWLFLISYMVVALPLWLYNWQVFGHPTFNYAMTHHMWMDQWEQDFRSEVALLPTMTTYWQNHSWGEMGSRAWNGLIDMRYFVLKMLWPTRSLALDEFYLSPWSGVALISLLGGLFAAYRRVSTFVAAQREAVILTILMTAVFYVLFAWYLVIVPIPIRFLLPLLPILLLFIAAALVGLGRWIVTAPQLPRWSKVAVGVGMAALGGSIGYWFVISSLAHAQALRQNPFSADSEFNSSREQPLQWIRTGHLATPINVLVAPGHTLPAWRHSDRLNFILLPDEDQTPASLEAFLISNQVTYVVVDAQFVNRQRELAQTILGVDEVMEDRVKFGAWPAGWALGFVYPEALCQRCVFGRMTAKSPTHATNFVLGDAIELIGYNLISDDFQPGGQLILTLYWRSIQSVSINYTVFTQVLGPGPQLYGQLDRQPVDGHVPTSRWQPGQAFVDKFVLEISENAVAGKYQVLVGLYDLKTGQRLPVKLAGGLITGDAINLHNLQMPRLRLN